VRGLALGLPPADLEKLMDAAGDPGRNRLTIDLPSRTISAADGTCVPFALDARRQDALPRGLDAIAATLDPKDPILAFEKAHHQANPWLAPGPKPTTSPTPHP